MTALVSHPNPAKTMNQHEKENGSQENLTSSLDMKKKKVKREESRTFESGIKSYGVVSGGGRNRGYIQCRHLMYPGEIKHQKGIALVQLIQLME